MKNGFLATYTAWIVLINCVAFLIALILASSIGQDAVHSALAIKPATVLAGQALWTFITSMFMHVNLTHLFVNMVSLMFIGAFTERLIGRKRFLMLYFISGLFAGIFFVGIAYFTGNDLDLFAVGASGAIFGLGGLLMILTPRLPVLVMFIIPMPMWLAMIFLLGLLWFISITTGLPIGNTAHLGGLIAGVTYGLYLKRRYPKRTKMIAQYFSR